MISVFFPGHSKDVAVDFVLVFISIFVPLMVSFVAINTPRGAPLSVFACHNVVAKWEDLTLIYTRRQPCFTSDYYIRVAFCQKEPEWGLFGSDTLDVDDKDAHTIL